MGKLFKGCLTVIIAVVALIIIIAIFAGGGEGTDQETGSEPDESVEDVDGNENSENEESTSEDSAETEKGLLTEEKFEQIQSGMTYDEVVEIIGSEGELISETGEEGTEFHTEMYMWDATDSVLGNANFTFQGSELTSKAQAGLGDSSEVTITLDEFNQLENGMTTEEVFDIVGGEGELSSETGEEGTEFHTVSYTYYGENGFGANASLMFQGGKLMSKSQTGLE
ncbi:Beta-lactamase inhibitor (BLIP) [Alteribacillus persepolensis]|uniref:Beta-lactamase inhibitor (BLIP) n=1 Tax=Alteribacillus persepolensis TaxID=568899 RepID=A0A1G8IMS0_9BACI|nr:DUF3862 domain-containing protein [Alteribacillus persepolensis]SDI19810.1 Beta-lactamase inhibitor (BLIP) [Alteribacillus persepolensis]